MEKKSTNSTQVNQISTKYLVLFIGLLILATAMIGFLISQAYETDLYFASSGNAGSTPTTQDAF